MSNSIMGREDLGTLAPAPTEMHKNSYTDHCSLLTMCQVQCKEPQVQHLSGGHSPPTDGEVRLQKLESPQATGIWVRTLSQCGPGTSPSAVSLTMSAQRCLHLFLLCRWDV